MQWFNTYIYIYRFISFSLQWVALLLAKEEDTKEVNKIEVLTVQGLFRVGVEEVNGKG